MFLKSISKIKLNLTHCTGSIDLLTTDLHVVLINIHIELSNQNTSVKPRLEIIIEYYYFYEFIRKSQLIL